MNDMTIPADWTFRNASVAHGFDRHVREQLPWYDMATGAVAHIARHYIPQNGVVYDIGASTGNIGRALADTLTARHARLIAIEASSDMAALYSGPGELLIDDATECDVEPFDVAVCFLMLMFVPVAKRRAFVRKLVARMLPGGALIIFDKEEAASGYVGTVLHRLTLAGKVATGTNPAAIVEKELSLSGIQRPLSPRFIQTLCVNAHEIFRFGEFAGYVIEAQS